MESIVPVPGLLTRRDALRIPRARVLNPTPHWYYRDLSVRGKNMEFPLHPTDKAQTL